MSTNKKREVLSSSKLLKYAEDYNNLRVKRNTVLALIIYINSYIVFSVHPLIFKWLH